MRTPAFILLWLYVFTLPWDYMLQFSVGIGSAGRVAGLLAFVACTVLIATTARMRRFRTFQIATAAYLAVVAASLFWTANPESTAHSVRSYVQSAMMVWAMWELGSKWRDLFRLATAYVAGASVAAISVFHNFSAATVELEARQARFAADNWDVNDLALVLSLAIPLAFYVATKRLDWISTCLARAYLLVGPMAIVLTSSRSGVVVMTLAILALPLFLNRQTLRAKVIVAMVVACAAWIAWNYAPQQSWDRLSTLLPSLRAGDLNFRDTIWRNGLRAFGSHYLVGVGAGAFETGAGINFSAHNTFLAVLVEQGLIGFGVFSVILACAIHCSLRIAGTDRKMCVVLLLCWAVGTFTLGWAANRVTWFVLGLVISFGSARESRKLSNREVALT